jgi:hypothetical protein
VWEREEVQEVLWGSVIQCREDIFMIFAISRPMHHGVSKLARRTVLMVRPAQATEATGSYGPRLPSLGSGTWSCQNIRVSML